MVVLIDSTTPNHYVYIPLGGNRDGKLKQIRNLIITMFLGGLWHGAGTLFIAWGLWHGFLLVLYRVFPIEQQLSRLRKVGSLIMMIVMCHLTCLRDLGRRHQRLRNGNR
jgi:alginate O-acetyltransferase complex protein AlgI